MTSNNEYKINMDIKQFKQHFLASEVFNIIKNDPNVEPIMIYITGSTLTGYADEQSDYDLCVLIREKPSDWSSYVRPLRYFAMYTPENRKCQWVYNDLTDIQKVSIFPQDNIGWTQFRYITDNLILYKNTNYTTLIENLIAQRESISINSLFMFLRSCCVGLQIPCPSEITEQHLEATQKLAYHLVWAANELPKLYRVSASKELIIKLKRAEYSSLSKEEKQHVQSALCMLQKFFIEHKQKQVSTIKF